MPQAIFRVDASDAIGTGHLVRCLTLAGALRAHGVEVSFVCREHAGHLGRLVEQQGYAVGLLPLSDAFDAGDDDNAYAPWLGASWQDDAAQTRALIEALPTIPDWLIIDHYAIDQRWEDTMRAAVGNILVIDDLADRNHAANLLLDQNLVPRMQDRYAGKVSSECRLLLGPDYALLQSPYAELHERAIVRAGRIGRLLVFFGGSDVHDLTSRTLTALLRLNRPDIEVDMVISETSPHAEDIRRQIAVAKNVHLHSGLPSLAPLMAKADLAIGAGGVTTWERLCLGLPALVVTVAENQREIAEELDRRGLVRHLGHHDQVDVTMIETALGDALGKIADGQWSRRCLDIVDGKGAARVSTVLTATTATPLQVRRVVPADEAQLLEWSNDPVTRANAFSPQKIDAATHREWFQARLRDIERCHFYIVETGNGIPIGAVRFQEATHGWEVHFSLAPMFRGRGLGRRLVEVALLNLRADKMDIEQIVGRVKAGNLASRRIFEALAFESEEDPGGEVVVYRRAL